jgi:peptidyl-prolyl cis-trans isomerase C
MILKRILCFLLLLLFALPGCDFFEKPDEKTVITVGEREISVLELKQDIKRYTSEMGITEGGLEQVLQPLVNRIVDNYLILEYGRREGITISDEELNLAIKNMEKDYSEQDLRKILLQGYLDFDEWKEGLREYLLVKKIINKASEGIPPVSHQEIKMYFDSHPDEFKRPAMVKFRQIVVDNKEDAEKIWRRLNQGEDMGQLAGEYSITPEAENGGEVDWIAEENLDETMGKALFSLPVGKISPVIKSVYGFHIFQVIAKRPEGMQSLPDSIKEIETKLFYQKEDDFYKNWLEQLRNTFPVVINNDLLKTLELG